MDNTDKKIIINVGRQIGSGGRIIAKMLADTFGCKFYDKELLNLAAKESGFSEKFFEQNDEQKGFLKSLFHIHVPLMGENNFYKNNFSQTRSISYRATPSAKQPKKAVVSSWDGPLIMYCATSKTQSVFSLQPTLTSASSVCASDTIWTGLQPANIFTHGRRTALLTTTIILARHGDTPRATTSASTPVCLAWKRQNSSSLNLSGNGLISKWFNLHDYYQS